MPDPAARRTIRGHQHRPTTTGNYAASTAAQLQGAASNRTASYTAGIDAHDPGRQAFYREALTGIPHPLRPGQTISYGQLQTLLKGPEKAAALAAYGAANRMDRTPTAKEYAQAAFDKSQAALTRRAAEQPGELAFPAAAIEAQRASNRTIQLARGNFAGTEGQQAVNAATQAQRYALLPEAQGVATAPGMSMKPLVPSTVAPRRTIKGAGAIARN